MNTISSPYGVNILHKKVVISKQNNCTNGFILIQLTKNPMTKIHSPTTLSSGWVYRTVSVRGKTGNWWWRGLVTPWRLISSDTNLKGYQPKSVEWVPVTEHIEQAGYLDLCISIQRCKLSSTVCDLECPFDGKWAQFGFSLAVIGDGFS